MTRIIIIGATSGIGNCIAHEFISLGWQVGIAGRRKDLLDALQATAPSNVVSEVIDVTDSNAAAKLNSLISKLGGMDIFLLASGVGNQNANLDSAIEERTIATNVLGFTRMVDTAYLYFKQNAQQGHIAVISSIAGTKGLGVAASYSATKRYQNSYIEALDQLAHMQKLNISFTDIRPGFVTTDLLNDSRKYPMQLAPQYTAHQIVKAILAKRKVIVIDWRYAVMVALWRLIPRAIWTRLNVSN